jgi:DNA (cytosine-5)-methyltransferase 1
LIPGLIIRHTPRYHMSDESPTLIDLFSGCGGLALGMHEAGFQTVMANELHPDPASTYVHNICPQESEKMLVGPIQKQLSRSRLDKWLSECNYDIDCVAGGPPCQGFSMAGKGDAGDPRNNLFKDYLRVVGKVMPKSVIFENVPGFANRYGLGLRERLQGYLHKKGYEIASGVLKASDYGVPQLRKRFIAVGVRKDLLDGRALRLPEPSFPIEKQLEQLTCEKVIGDLDTYSKRGGYGSGTTHGEWEYHTRAIGKFQRKMREVSGQGTRGITWNTKIPAHTPKVVRRMKLLIEGRKRSDFEGSDLQTAKHSQRPLLKNEVPNITVVSIPDDYIHYNPELPRTLSVRECARLQTFPDHFHFLGKRTSGGLRRRIEVPQYTQVGNAIPPRLSHALGRHLIDILEKR